MDTWIGNESYSIYLLLTFPSYLDVLYNSERDLGHVFFVLTLRFSGDETPVI
jgi:hypothetical protein